MNYQKRYFHRQTLVFGQEIQAQVRSLKVYVSGLRMVGLELVKNLIMMGVQQIMLFDNSTVEKQDINNSFYYKPHHIGCIRSESCLQKFKELAQFTKLTLCTSNDIDFISQNFDVVVLVNCWDYEFTKALNYSMHKKQKGFILVTNLSLYGFIFADFGQNHIIKDKNGQMPNKKHIINISREKQAKIQFVELSKHFIIGEEIIIYRVIGMDEINGRVVKIINRDSNSGLYTVNIDTSQFSEYRSGGVAKIHHQEAKKMVFECIDDNLKLINLIQSQEYLTEPQKYLSNSQSIIIKTFYQFYSKSKKTHIPLSNQERKQFLETASQLLDQTKAKEHQKQNVYQVLNKLAFVGFLQISAFATLWGGIAAQQVIKFTGKYTPIHQWLHFDQTHLISNKPQLNDCKYSFLFGDDMVDKLSNSKIMMIGGGSLGSQIIKMASEMKIGSGKEGFITVVDDDSLNQYNLNRMCLVNKEDCGQNKAELLASKGRELNRQINLRSIKQRIKGVNSKQQSNIPWKSHEIVISAVDSHFSRYSIDTHCVKHKKIMLNCGAEDLKCSTEVIIPYQTSDYSAMHDYLDQSVSISQLPYKMNMVGTIAALKLQEYMQIKSSLYQLTINKQYFLNENYKQYKYRQSQFSTKLQSLISYLQIKKSKSFAKCIELALMQFYLLFYLKTKELLKAYPEDWRDRNFNNRYFWSGIKNVPRYNTLNLGDPIHCEFIYSLVNIYSQILDLEGLSFEDTIDMARIIGKTGEYIKRSQRQVDKKQYSSIQLSNRYASIDKKIRQEQFDTKSQIKFQPSNPSSLHLSFLYSFSILTARMHQLEEVPRIQIEKITCNVVPTVITNISISAALIMLELIQVLKNNLEYAVCRNSYANFALPRIVQSSLNSPKLIKDSFFDPISMNRTKAIPECHSLWQQINIVGPMTVREIKEHFETRLKIQVEVITVGDKFLLGFNPRMNQVVIDLQISNALKELKSLNVQLPIQLIIYGTTSMGQRNTQFVLPPVHYHLPS